MQNTRTLDPRCKLYLLLLSNLLLFLHVNIRSEILLMAFLLLPFYWQARSRKRGIRLTLTYLVLLWADICLVPIASGLAQTWVSLLAVGVRMMLPCLVAGSYAFTTTSVGEFVCALRKMKVPEAVIIPCMVVIRFFPTIREDYRQIRNSMELRGTFGGTSTAIFHPMRSLEYVIIPLLMNSSNVAQDLSVAALTKGLGIPNEHTSLAELHFRIFDGVYMVLCTIPLLLPL